MKDENVKRKKNLQLDNLLLYNWTIKMILGKLTKTKENL